MTTARFLKGAVALGAFLSFAVSGAVAAGLIVNGDFSACKSSKDLRRGTKDQGWYESRKDGKGRLLLKLSTKAIGLNKTPKAMIKANPDLNVYMSQKLASGQTGTFRIQYEIYVREILADDNRSAFFLVGNDQDDKGGPNSTGADRFVFMGFENATQKGKINLFARQGKADWTGKTIVAANLDLHKWYTIEAIISVSAGTYEVSVKGATPQPVKLAAFVGADKPPKSLTHLSFASWNDGAGTFYIDNVLAEQK